MGEPESAMRAADLVHLPAKPAGVLLRRSIIKLVYFAQRRAERR
jgi:hypothetical protein